MQLSGAEKKEDEFLMPSGTTRSSLTGDLDSKCRTCRVAIFGPDDGACHQNSRNSGHRFWVRKK